MWFWVKAIAIILVLRAFLFEPYRIPSESMEDTLLWGDFLIVSKLNYGARTPNTIGVPFTGLYVPGLRLPQTRLPGFGAPERGDVVVFNYPASVDVERGRIPEDVPIERRAPYIKRIIGVPGDTLAVIDKAVHIDGRPLPLVETMKQRWRVTATGGTRPNARQFAEMGVEFVEGSDVRRNGALVSPREFDVFATPDEVRAIQALPDIASVAPFALPESATQPMVYPQGSGWNADQYGPVVVPGRGLTVPLNSQTWPVYAEVIDRYEGRTVGEASDGSYVIDGRIAREYTFGQDYYFVMGDFRDNSVDSRFWGFVPESHLVGKAVFKFISVQKEFPFVRLGRFFRPID